MRMRGEDSATLVVRSVSVLDDACKCARAKCVLNRLLVRLRVLSKGNPLALAIVGR